MADDILTDDAVAARLIKDAENSLRFSSLGMESSGPRPENKPKPNTRFLRNIIRTTETHNAALLAREAAESAARLQELSDAEERTRRRRRPEPAEMRRRQMGDIAAILRGGRRKREGNGDERATRSDGGEVKSRRRRHSRERRSEDDEERRRERRRDRGKRHGIREPRREEDGSRHRRRSRSQSRLRTPEATDRHHRRRSRSPSSDRHRHRRSRRDRSPLKYKDEGHIGNRSINHKSHCSRTPPEENDSDPLEDLIGPQPAPAKNTTRGRGSTAHTSGIDARFSASYDPADDVPPPVNDDSGDWDDAVDSFRDRQRWKAQGAERLRAAGFTDEQVKKWEKTERPGGGEAGIEDVRWAKKGETRQWDRGKTVNVDGTVTSVADWATEGT